MFRTMVLSVARHSQCPNVPRFPSVQNDFLEGARVVANHGAASQVLLFLELRVRFCCSWSYESGLVGVGHGMVVGVWGWGDGCYLRGHNYIGHNYIDRPLSWGDGSYFGTFIVATVFVLYNICLSILVSLIVKVHCLFYFLFYRLDFLIRVHN